VRRIQDRYVKLGLTVFAAGAALIVLYQVIVHFDKVQEALSVIRDILSPFIFGLVMAYLLCPVYNTVVRRMYHVLKDRLPRRKMALRWARVMGTIMAMLTLTGIVGGLFALVLPETVRSILGLIQMLPDRLTDLIEWGENTFTADRWKRRRGRQ